MSEKRAARGSFAGTGFYIALFLGVTALAVAGYWMLLPATEPDRKAAEPVPVIVVPEQSAKNVAAVPPEDEPEEESETAVLPPVQAIAPVKLPEKEVVEILPVEPRLIVPPLEGEVIGAFSAEQLAYNETLSDWRTHNGVDIAAEEGTHVLAACSGTVRSVTKDDLMGTTVVLAHGDGCETVYANLQQTATVAPEQYVSAGQVIGCVGSTALIESAAPPHLHFAVMRDGKPVDPIEFLES